VIDDHIADSLVALELPELGGARAIADIGAGAGVPGLPLAIALPSARVALVESNHRKADFAARAIEECDIANAQVVAERVEAWPAGLRRFDAVTARAVAPLDVVAEYAAPLLRVGGALVVWRGHRDAGDEADASRAAEILGLRVLEPRRVEPYPSARQRHLHVMCKVMETPASFPRRPGIARKRPLGPLRASDRVRR
jgi:16S rRNA (guanine527-N7)-methyltransferase